MLVSLINLAYKGSQVKSLPLGMAIIAHFLQKSGHGVQLLDAELEKLDLEDVYEWCLSNPSDFVAINATSYSRFDAVLLAKRLKEDGVRWIVLGGHHYSHMPAETLHRYPFIDFVVCGPAEQPMTELCNALANELSVEAISGLAFRNNDEIVNNKGKAGNGFAPPSKIPYELFDLTGYSTYDDLLFLNNDLHRLNIEKGRTITFFLSRGCPYDCYFCANVNYWSDISFKQLDGAIAEIRYLQEEFGITHFIMIDPTFTFNRAYTVEFCKRLIRENLQIKYFCSTRVNLVDEALLELMVRSGLQCIQFGIESGSQEVLTKISKGINLDDVKQKTLMAARMGLVVKGYFMFGHPGEGEKDVLKTISFAKDLYSTSDGLFVPVSMFTDIYPGSRLEIAAKADGRLEKDFSWFERKEYPQNKKISMGWTNVPIYENKECKIERILELAHGGFPELLNKELFQGYDNESRKRQFREQSP